MKTKKTKKKEKGLYMAPKFIWIIDVGLIPIKNSFAITFVRNTFIHRPFFTRCVIIIHMSNFLLKIHICLRKTLEGE